MGKYSCIIVEDEPLAAEVLQDYVHEIHFLELKATCTNAIYAMEMLQKEQIDLIFLDIHLPKVKGLDFLRTLKDSPQVIITSAYQEYALQGYELNVIDYLLKPIEFNRFLMAVNKIRSTAKKTSGKSIANTKIFAGELEERPHLFFNVSKKRVKIYIDDILYIESLKEYIKVVTKEKSILTKFQLNQVEDLLPKGKFLRIHRSFIVSRAKIEAFTSTDVEIGGTEIPIGRNYKVSVFSQLAKLNS